MEAILVLESGEVFRGRAFGATGEACGELVFNTSMTGYQEILSDPSYKGQIVTMTYPLIGNYGVNEADFESNDLHLSGFVVREYCDRPAGPRATRSLGLLLKEKRIVGISEIDTRGVTQLLRSRGCVKAIISTEESSVEKLLEKLSLAPGIEGRDLVREVATSRAYRFQERIERHWYANIEGGTSLVSNGRARLKLAVLDFGMKSNIARILVGLGARVTVYPPDTKAREILDKEYDGVLLSNGPGDPRAVGYAVETAKGLMEHLPVFGICLGHQILGLAMGARIEKLKFGHHGGNHPVKDLASGRVLITSQNHNYALVGDSLDARVKISHVNLNDGTVEGIEHRNLPVFSVQYHPEASPGPHDALHHFTRFFVAVEERRASRVGPETPARKRGAGHPDSVQAPTSGEV